MKFLIKHKTKKVQNMQNYKKKFEIIKLEGNEKKYYRYFSIYLYDSKVKIPLLQKISQKFHKFLFLLSKYLVKNAIRHS